MADIELLDRIKSADNLTTLEELRVAALGKSGSITSMLKTLGQMDAETRASEAPKIHALREAVTDALAAKKSALENAELERRLATERLDLSLPAQESPRGSIHPVSQVMDDRYRTFWSP